MSYIRWIFFIECISQYFCHLQTSNTIGSCCCMISYRFKWLPSCNSSHLSFFFCLIRVVSKCYMLVNICYLFFYFRFWLTFFCLFVWCVFFLCLVLYMLHTVLERSYNYWIWSWSITDSCASQNPNLIIGPSFQFIQYDIGDIDGHDRCLAIGQTVFHQVYFVINNSTIGSFNRWRLPWYSYRCWAGRFCADICWRRTRH